MPHEFTGTDEAELQGIWFKNNGRRYCAWRYDSNSKTLMSRRGVVVRSAVLEAETTSLEELKEQLPKMALELAKETKH